MTGATIYEAAPAGGTGAGSSVPVVGGNGAQDSTTDVNTGIRLDPEATAACLHQLATGSQLTVPPGTCQWCATAEATWRSPVAAFCAPCLVHVVKVTL